MVSGGEPSVAIDASVRRLGIATRRHFLKSVERDLPWRIDVDGRLLVKRPRPLLAEADAAPPGRILDLAALGSERLSRDVATTIASFKRVEDKLPDFSREALSLFRPYWGLTDSWIQWSNEERQHSRALGEVLQRTGTRTGDDLDEDYYVNLASRWHPPFYEAEEVLVYGLLQETVTCRAYLALANAAEIGGARTAAKVLRVIASDEAYHAAGYRGYLNVFFDQEPDRTRLAALKVGSNFRMPSHGLALDPIRELRAAIRVGAFSSALVEEVLVSTLRRLPSILPTEAASAAKSSLGSL